MSRFSFGALVSMTLATTIIACDNPIEPNLLRLEPLQVTYAPGDFVSLRLANLTADTIRIGDCDKSLWKLEGSRWVDASHTDAVFNANCADGLRIMYPGGSGTIGGPPLSPTSREGIYRVRFGDIRRQNDQLFPVEDRTSTPFRVAKP